MLKTCPNNLLSLTTTFRLLILVLVFSQCSKKEADPVPPITVTDIDGNVYKTVKIGTQTWMAENLKVTRYRNGDLIHYIPEDYYWATTNGAYCHYLNDDYLTLTYGLLYNWYAVCDPRNIAPVGWHVPSEEEWSTLITYLGGNDVAGGKIKEAGLTHWSNVNAGATNSSGFTALPAGWRDKQCNFDEMTTSTAFWSSTELSLGIRVYGLFYDQEAILPMQFSSIYGLSCRCIKD